MARATGAPPDFVPAPMTDLDLFLATGALLGSPSSKGRLETQPRPPDDRVRRARRLPERSLLRSELGDVGFREDPVV